MQRRDFLRYSALGAAAATLAPLPGMAASARKTVSKNLEAYFDYLAAEKKEAAAHFANLYVQKTYPEAVSFIARECGMLTMSMIIYVQGISAA